MNLLEAKKIENQNLKEVIRRWPRFFEIKTFIDNQKFLEKYGIFISEKKKLPLGYLKLWPQDFIVEEIASNGELQTVFPEKFLHKKREFSFQDPITFATLVKCGLSTIEAAEELAKNLKIKPRDIKIAGIKDKHAITSQLISIKNCSAEKIHQVSASYFFVKNVFSGKKELHVGNLRGNQFTILIRTDPHFQKDQFLKRLDSVQKNGFYNFFYLQRFGIPRLINPYCGLAILKGDYEGAIKSAICRPGKREIFYFQALRKEIEKRWGNWEEIEEILESFPLTFQDEKKLVNYLIQKPDDFVGALNQIPMIVQLWLASFSALLFNKLISFYLKQGKNPPKTLPLPLEKDKKTWRLYENLLKKIGLFSQTFVSNNLKPFPYINLGKKERKTIEKVKILNQKVFPEGVILSFVLPKGCYATTFLSHLFNLVSGLLPSKFSNLPIDTKANLNQPSLEGILNQFIDIVSSPSWRIFWRIY